jgi:predicted Zn-dependent peptidase
MYEKTVLDNGLRVVGHNMPDRHSLALGIWISVGGRYESLKNKGISHFLEHLAFKGTRKYSCRQIKESIEGIGGSLNGFTSEELTCYLVKIPADYLELALDILSDMVINPILQKSDIEKEKTVILEEIKMYKDQPQSYVYDLLDELLWPKQPLGVPIIGTAEAVTRMSRQDLAKFKQKYYTPKNIVVSAAGQLDYENLTQKINKIFSRTKKENANKFLASKDEQAKPRLKIFPKDTEQTHLALGFKGFKRDHPLKHALGLLHITLGANMSSRLFDELREKRGLAYEIGTLVRRFSDTGAFIVHAGIDNGKVKESVKLILEELKKIREKLITEDEFRRAKEFYLGQLRLALEDTLDHMLWIGETTATLDRTYSLEDIIKEVDKVEREDIRKAAQAIFKGRKLNLALIGPLKNIEDKLYKKLHID